MTQIYRQLTKALTLVLFSVFLTACSAIASRNNTGVVVSRSAQIRSSTAVVAADLYEVKRGETIDILDAIDIPDPTDNTKKERWYRARARDEGNTEGWIEARNIMPESVLDKAHKLADEDKSIQAQATGQLHAGSNLRLTPDRGTNENIMMRLDSGSSFEIIGWKRVPKFKGAESTESDTAPNLAAQRLAQTKSIRTRKRIRKTRRRRSFGIRSDLRHQFRRRPRDGFSASKWS